MWYIGRKPRTLNRTNSAKEGAAETAKPNERMRCFGWRFLILWQACTSGSARCGGLRRVSTKIDRSFAQPACPLLSTRLSPTPVHNCPQLQPCGGYSILGVFLDNDNRCRFTLPPPQPASTAVRPDTLFPRTAAPRQQVFSACSSPASSKRSWSRSRLRVLAHGLSSLQQPQTTAVGYHNGCTSWLRRASSSARNSASVSPDWLAQQSHGDRRFLHTYRRIGREAGAQRDTRSNTGRGECHEPPEGENINPNSVLLGGTPQSSVCLYGKRYRLHPAESRLQCGGFRL